MHLYLKHPCHQLALAGIYQYVCATTRDKNNSILLKVTCLQKSVLQVTLIPQWLVNGLFLLNFFKLLRKRTSAWTRKPNKTGTWTYMTDNLYFLKGASWITRGDLMSGIRKVRNMLPIRKFYKEILREPVGWKVHRERKNLFLTTSISCNCIYFRSV